MQIVGTLTPAATLTGTLTAGAGIQGTFTVPAIVETEPYTGDYTVTPSSVAQEVPVEGFRMLHNLVVNPVPSNYGLITWNGSTITVS